MQSRHPEAEPVIAKIPLLELLAQRLGREPGIQPVQLFQSGPGLSLAAQLSIDRGQVDLRPEVARDADLSRDGECFFVFALSK